MGEEEEEEERLDIVFRGFRLKIYVSVLPRESTLLAPPHTTGDFQTEYKITIIPLNTDKAPARHHYCM